MNEHRLLYSLTTLFLHPILSFTNTTTTLTVTAPATSADDDNFII